MKTTKMISAATLALILGTAAFAAPSAKKIDGMATVGDAPVHSYYGFSDTAVKTGVAHALNAHNAMMKQAPKEVLTGLDETLAAVRALEHKDVKAAHQLLAKASAAFDAALKANPSLKRVPVADDIAVTEIAATPEEIARAVDMAKKALDAHRLEEARGLLAPLRDEMVIATQYLPMDLYPSATRLAASMLGKGHVKEALQTLNTAMGTLETDEVVIPMPLVRAQAFVDEASKLDKTKRKEAEKLLDAASTELKKAVLLGYTDRHADDYKALSGQIEKLRKATEDKNEVEKLYDKVKSSFESLFHKTREDAYHDSVVKEEATALKNPAAVKDSAAARAKVEEEQAKALFEAKEKRSIFHEEATSDEHKTR